MQFARDEVRIKGQGYVGNLGAASVHCLTRKVGYKFRDRGYG